MRRKWIWLLVCWLMIAGVAGCGQAATSLSVETTPVASPDTPVGEVEPSPPVSAPSEKATPAEPGTPAPLGTAVPISPTQMIQEGTMSISPTIPSPSNPALQGLVMQAKEDLARRLSIEADQIELLEVSAVVWPDGGLGCPQPGMVYTQVQHDGALIRLRVGKRIYNYHNGGNRPPFLCEQAVGQAVGSDSLSPPPGFGDQ